VYLEPVERAGVDRLDQIARLAAGLGERVAADERGALDDDVVQLAPARIVCPGRTDEGTRRQPFAPQDRVAGARDRDDDVLLARLAVALGGFGSDPPTELLERLRSAAERNHSLDARDGRTDTGDLRLGLTTAPDDAERRRTGARKMLRGDAARGTRAELAEPGRLDDSGKLAALGIEKQHYNVVARRVRLDRRVAELVVDRRHHRERAVLEGQSTPRLEPCGPAREVHQRALHGRQRILGREKRVDLGLGEEERHDEAEVYDPGVEPLVDTAWLADRLGDPALRVLECTVFLDRGPDDAITVRSGRADWLSGHIPGSAFADLVVDLSDPNGLYRFTMPTAERFATAMEELGVGENTQVVLYDRSTAMWATRVWWMLRAFGFDEAAVLDGGWQAWTEAGGAVSRDDAPRRPAARFVARPRPALIAAKEDVVAALDSEETCIVNALPETQHRGEDRGYPRRGHIPGALNVPARRLLDPGTQRFLPPVELATQLSPLLAKPRVITYCGGGIAATADAFVLTLLGHRDVAVYDGSLLEWSSDPSLPLVVGD
jgi:thiosulfate/3-mercaptopyruvate sulfurtransferase